MQEKKNCTPTFGHKISASYQYLKNADDIFIISVFLCLFTCLTPTTSLATDKTFYAINFQPFETRDQNLFNLIHGQALPTNAKLFAENQAHWSNGFIITNTTNIESNSSESIYLDYEAYLLNLSYQYGINKNWNVKIDIPVIHKSGGVFDSAIDAWHEFFGLAEGFRPFINHNEYEIQYNDQSQTLVNLNKGNTTIGDIQISIAHSLSNNKNSSISLWGSIKLPTGDKTKLSGSGEVDMSTWLAMNQRLSDNWALNLNAGAVILGGNEYQKIPLSDYALYGHIMLGWLFTDNINLKLQLQGHTSYYDKSKLTILSDTYLLTFGTSIKINSCQQLDFALSEDIKLNSSPDVSLLINWRTSAAQC